MKATTLVPGLNGNQVVDVIAARAQRWSSDQVLGANLEASLHKRFSTVHVVNVRTSAGVQRVYAKQPSGSHAIEREAPDLHRSRLLVCALNDLGTAVDRLNDPHVSAIRVLDLIDDQIVVMSDGGDRPLKQLIRAQHRGRRRQSDLGPVMGRIGRLLRAFHDDVDRSAAPRQLDTRSEIRSSAQSYFDLVAEMGSRQPNESRNLEARLQAQIGAHIPSSVPVAAKFGDFGLTNILVDEGGVVVAIDSLAAVQAPRLADACYFTAGLRTMPSQIGSLGRAYHPDLLDQWETAFWNGYSDHPGAQPIGPVSVWTCLRLLDRWTARRARRSLRTGSTVAVALLDRFFMNEIERNLIRAERSTDGSQLDHQEQPFRPLHSTPESDGSPQ